MAICMNTPYQTLKNHILTKLSEWVETHQENITSDVICSSLVALMGRGPIRTSLFLFGWRINNLLLMEPQRKRIKALETLVRELEMNLEYYEESLKEHEDLPSVSN